MKFFQRFKNIFGYHIMEFTVLLVVVMASILVMGPYVLRSVNAQFKGWDDSVRDSVDDPLFLAEDNTPMPDCTCDLWSAVDCGLSICSQRQRLFDRTCWPLGCEETQTGPEVIPLERCIVDNCCCTAPQPTRNCGVQDTSLVGGRPSCSTPETDEVPLFADGTCPDDYMKSSISCGNETFDRYVCILDPVCRFRCQSPSTPTNNEAQTLCSGSEVRLPSDLNYTFLSYGIDCTGGKCEMQCSSACYQPTAGGCVQIPVTSVERNGCPSGFVDATGCSGGRVLQCCS